MPSPTTSGYSVPASGSRSRKRSPTSFRTTRLISDGRSSTPNVASVRELLEPTHRQDGGASNAEINRELGVLSRAFALAMESERIAAAPRFPRLKETAPRSGFFEREQFEAIRRHLPEYAQGPVTFMYETGWRKREVLDLKWKNVDLKAGLVRLDVGTTKTGGRIFPFTTTLRELLEEQRELSRRFEREHGVVVPYVFHQPAGAFGPSGGAGAPLGGAPVLPAASRTISDAPLAGTS